MIVLHAIFSIAHILSQNFGHPFLSLTGKFPFWGQFIVVSMVAILIYSLIGIVYASVVHDKQKLKENIIPAAIYFSLLLMGIYAVLYYLALQLDNVNFITWYAVANPWFGTYMLRLPKLEMYSLWWIIGTIIPGLSISLGSMIVLKYQEVKN